MTPFGFASTADAVLEGVRLDGRHAVVTGATSGIGVETARALPRQRRSGCRSDPPRGTRRAAVSRRPADYRGVARYAVDAGNAERLWQASQELLAAAR